MNDGKSAQVLVRRPSKIDANRGGDSVRADPAKGTELELVSTQMLKQILSSRDEKNRKAIEDAATGAGEGVLVRDTATGYFEIIDEDDLQAIIEDNQQLPKLSRPSDVTVEPLHDYADRDHLSLVSTRALRNVLGTEDEQDQAAATDVDPRDFDPYGSG